MDYDSLVVSFSQITGHRRLLALLSRSVEHDSLPPSLVFAGPAGVGKRLTALAVAQALNCLEVSRVQAPVSGFGFDACGTCAVCTRIVRGVHPDVVVVAPDDRGSIRMEHVRDIVDRSAYRPFEGRRRVVIIDDADALGIPPQHALLKTLEEPPSSSVFILVTARPDMLLPTVRSRCPQLRFRPLAADDIATVLVARGLSESEARAVAATADGSIGQALEASAGELVEARDIAQRVLEYASSNREPGRRIDGAKELLAKTGATSFGDRDQVASHLRAMASLLRDVEVLATRADDRTLANPDVRPALERLTQTYGGERGIRAFSAIDQALVALDRNAGVKLVADWVVLHL